MSANGNGPTGAGPLEILERFRKPKPRPGERCEMCGEMIAEAHSHVVDVQTRSLMCACRPCYLLFASDGSGGGHFKAVPDRVLSFPASTLTRGDWEGMQIPVGIAFFFFSTLSNEVHGFYPGPAGATESMLPLDTWQKIRDADPSLETIQPDVEALLVRAFATGDPDCYLVPIDACYELVGYLRMQWKGFDGGTEARRTIDEFFSGVQQKAKPAPPRARS